MVTVISRWDRQQRQLRLQRHGLFPQKLGLSSSRRNLFRSLLITLAIIAILPPLYFHFSLRRFHQIQLRNCGWMQSPPLVCAHGGDSTKAFPNTMDAYNNALSSGVDCIEIDVSRSSDGVLFALHDRELQRISGNSTSRVGYLTMKEIADLGSSLQHSLEFHDVNIPTIEDALKFVSGSVRQVILDAKVGPPLFDKGLAEDILSVVKRTKCRNCLVWAKSDSLARDVIKLSRDTMVGYIVMMDPSTGTRRKLLRMRGAGVVGVYHPLVDEELVRILHGRKKKVYTWTVDEEEWMKKMLLEGVDGVVTSNPALLQRVMQDRNMWVWVWVWEFGRTLVWYLSIPDEYRNEERGTEPKQLAFSAALGITLGVFPICGVTVFLCGIAVAVLRSLCHAPTVMLANFIATPIELSLMVPFLRFGEIITGGPHFPLTSDAFKKVLTGQASREALRSIFLALLGWVVAAPLILGALYLLLLPCFKILVHKFTAVPSSPKKALNSISSPRKPLNSPSEVRLKVRDV
ncbi:UNVERIFIED_CONTAM: Glycerophosphodiester phosphodiesterase GDPD4 [Sesamum radiatum]|uniref:glycerophosphodiester phosphodiesterase n=1 Tax=Sesamum radiatum TaxID=300843 RepID=A0AAW2PX30_SESRA